MTSITIRPDDGGIQSLKKENNATSTARELSPLSPITRTQLAQEYPPTPPQAPTQAVFRGPERRKGERRQTKDQVILDTRDKRERRRQLQDDEDLEDAPKIGIDVFG